MENKFFVEKDKNGKVIRWYTEKGLEDLKKFNDEVCVKKEIESTWMNGFKK